MADLVYIYGPPGAGKLTVARQLEAMLGYKLYHNHISIDAVLPVFEFGTEPFWRQVHLLRQNMLEEAARAGVSVLYTSAFAYPKDIELVRNRLAGVEAAGGTIQPVHLACAREAVKQRLVTEERLATSKLTSLEMLEEQMALHDFYQPIPDRESLRIDNTDLAAEEVARLIIAHYGLLPA